MLAVMMQAVAETHGLFFLAAGLMAAFKIPLTGATKGLPGGEA